MGLCRHCKIRKAIYTNGYCKECNRIISLNYYHKNKERIIQNYERLEKLYPGKRKAMIRLCTQTIRLKCLIHYSTDPPRCLCCGETEIKFLTLDHIEGASNLRKQGKYLTGFPLCAWLKRNNYPKGFQVLCFNCNMAKGFHGICPHNLSKV